MFLVSLPSWHELAVNRNLLACVKFAFHIPLGERIGRIQNSNQF